LINFIERKPVLSGSNATKQLDALTELLVAILAFDLDRLSANWNFLFYNIKSSLTLFFPNISLNNLHPNTKQKEA
jgi:hypothetical protein